MTVTEHDPTTTTLDEETRRVLARAKGILADGWWQPGRSDLAGGLCLTFAIAEIIGVARGPGEGAATNPYCRALGFDDYVAARVWNDARGRTQQDVIDRIDRALQDESGTSAA